MFTKISPRAKLPNVSLDKSGSSYSHTRMYGTKIGGRVEACQKVCPRRSPSVRLACNQQFALKVFASPLTRLPCCFSLRFPRWLNLLFLPSTPFSSPCLAAQCLQGPPRHSIIPLTTPSLQPSSPPRRPYLSSASTHCPRSSQRPWPAAPSSATAQPPVASCNGSTSIIYWQCVCVCGGGSLWTEHLKTKQVIKLQSHLFIQSTEPGARCEK